MYKYLSDVARAVVATLVASCCISACSPPSHGFSVCVRGLACAALQEAPLVSRPQARDEEETMDISMRVCTAHVHGRVHRGSMLSGFLRKL